MSKGGSTTSTSSIDPQIKEAFLTNFQQAQGVAGALPTQQFAGFNPMYQAGEQALVNTGLAGPGISGTDLAAQMAAYGGVYQPAAVQASQLSGSNISNYLNPFQNTVIQNTLGDIESARQAANRQIGQQATQARAFGGSRQGVAEALTNAAYGKQAASTAAQMRTQGFDTAAALAQQDIARQQAADLANQAAGLQGAQLRLSGANQLGGLAAQQQALRLGGAQAVMGAGGARQALDQQQMDAIRNIGLQRLGVVQSSLGAQPANLGMISQTPYTQNVGAGALGGALAGAKLGSVVPGIGTAMGAIGGGILGMFG